MPNLTALPDLRENPQVQFKNHKKYLEFGKFGVHPGKLGAP